MLSNGLENNFGRAGEKRLLISIYYDGGARGNPGPAGSGADVVIEKFDEATAPPSKSQVQIRKFLGNTTNNVAEYNGVISGLEEAKQQICQYVKICPQGRVRVMVKGDSNLVTCQLNGSYTCKATKLIPLHRQAKQLTAEICGLGKSNFFDGTTTQVEVIFQHVYREHNKVADTLANEAMDTKRSWTSKVGDDRKKNIAERSV
mmetsp:Transcript_8370/g.12098  ORF Transcript_8370/g.12098 Transcript_8370/m.12098 type:complete len:203 (-) Transcript_8370:3305-3913(-)